MVTPADGVNFCIPMVKQRIRHVCADDWWAFSGECANGKQGERTGAFLPNRARV